MDLRCRPQRRQPDTFVDHPTPERADGAHITRLHKRTPTFTPFLGWAAHFPSGVSNLSPSSLPDTRNKFIPQKRFDLDGTWGLHSYYLEATFHIPRSSGVISLNSIRYQKLRQ